MKTTAHLSNSILFNKRYLQYGNQLASKNSKHLLPLCQQHHITTTTATTTATVGNNNNGIFSNYYYQNNRKLSYLSNINDCIKKNKNNSLINNNGNNNKLNCLSKYSIISMIAQRINDDISEIRKDIQFNHILEQKSDWMSYLILQIIFRKNTTIINIKSYDKNLFHISAGLYNRFKRKSGLIPKNTFRSPTANHEVTIEMAEWVMKFMKDQNISYIHLQLAGFNRTRNLVLTKVFDTMNVMQLCDNTSFNYDRPRRPNRPNIKARYRPKGSIRVGRSRLRKTKPPIVDPIDQFGAG